MTIHPVESAPAPGYPDKSRWLAAPLAVGISAVMALGFGSCGERVTMGDMVQMPTDITTTQPEPETEPPDCTTFVTMGTSAPVPEDTYITMGVPPMPVREIE